MNLVLLAGRLLTVPEPRERLGGGRQWSFDLSTTLDHGAVAATSIDAARPSVPVVWVSDDVPSAWGVETELAVAGIVRRRFFRSGGSTQSRTEVVAGSVVEITKRRPAARAVERALAALGPGSEAWLRSLAG